MANPQLVDQFGGKTSSSWSNLVGNFKFRGSVWWQIPSLVDQFGGKSPVSWINLVANSQPRGSIWW
ncbi:hypothetical protein [Zooshikella ganghwensis]|uniref:Uncharacterized protein n=1 Tax=Zooshikella ganghwensis TaxID=202772 RepID=A0A4P9VEA2_9GAMM|nr:hypothetical protein [Zooshikella ganghwensis]RDH41340.1 hypothetical protein B9G39_29155 [Zooshikella ganghwensis]RDH41373.1 hypothetical protein B9G39_29320 [Zooshikella ganghwensis]